MVSNTLTILENHQCRNASDALLRRERFFLFDVHAHDFCSPRLEFRCQSVSSTISRCSPEDGVNERYPSTTGCTAREGPFHGAWKKTRTGSLELSTSCSKLASVTSRRVIVCCVQIILEGCRCSGVLGNEMR